MECRNLKRATDNSDTSRGKQRLSEIEHFVSKLEHFGVVFWIADSRLRWHSIAALRLEQVLAIKKHEAEIIAILERRAA